jgi:hypothetical protein
VFTNQDKFTVEEVNLMCIYDTSSRKSLIYELSEALFGFRDSDLIEIANSAIDKLRRSTDEEYEKLKFYPVYGDDGYNEESEV